MLKTYLKVAFETSQLVKRPDKTLMAKHQRNMLIFNAVGLLLIALIALGIVISGYRTSFFFVIAWSIFLFLTSKPRSKPEHKFETSKKPS